MMISRTPQRLLIITLVVGLTMLIPRPAAAADPADDPSTAQQLTAHRLGQLARSVMAGSGPRSQRLSVARTLLDQAAELDPNNAELGRLRTEAVELLNDRPSLRAALNQYLRAAPSDDAAQLRLIELLVDEAQTAGERLEIYSRLIEGDRAEQLTPALRSRMALQAAMLHHERGETQRFGEMLNRAISLDPAHHAASLEAYRFLQQRNASPVGLAQSLLNLLAADPSDGSAHAELAAMLLHCGQYEQALQWFDSAGGLWAYQGRPQGDRLFATARDWAMALWGSGRGDEAITFIQSFNAPGGENEEDAPNPPQAEDAVPVGLQSIIVAIHMSRDRRAEADRAFTQLIRSLTDWSDAAPDAPDRLIDRIWAHLLFDRGIDEVPPLMDRLAEMLHEDDPMLHRLRGWLLLRQGDEAEAERVLTSVAEEDMVALFGLCLLHEDQGRNDRDQRLRRLNRVYAERPGGLIGLMAAERIRRLDARPQPSDACQSIARLAQQVPDNLRQLSTRPRRTVMLRARLPQRTIRYAQPVKLEIELTNTSGLPLALGPGQTLPADAIILTDVTIDGQPAPAPPPPHVVELHRRLRLEPGESLTVTTRIDTPGGPDAPGLAEMLHDNPTREVRVQVAVVLHPRFGPESEIYPGLLGMEVPVGSVDRPAWNPADETVDRELAILNGDTSDPEENDPATAMRVAARLAHAIPTLDENRTPQRIEEIIRALHAAYERFSIPQKAWLVSHLPRTNQAHQRFAPILDAAAGSDQPLIQYVLLTSHVDTPDSPILSAALSQNPGPIRDFAQQFRDTLPSP